MKVAPLALLALLVVPLHAQGPNDFDATRVRQLLASIQKQLPEAARDVGWLTDTVPQKGTIPAEVGQQLEAFEQALRSGANEELRRLIREELEIKADYCRRHPAGMAAMIPLTIRTWMNKEKSSDEVSRWNVMYLSAPLAVLRTKGEPFPNFSSPTTRRLAPGKYVVWAEDPNDARRQGPRKTITLGAPKVKLDEAVNADLLVAN